MSEAGCWIPSCSTYADANGNAGVLGQVGSSGVLNLVDCSVGFRLQAPPTGARILSAGLRCALLNKGAAKRQPGTRSAFMADLGKLATAEDKVHLALPCLVGLLQPASDVTDRSIVPLSLPLKRGLLV